MFSNITTLQYLALALGLITLYYLYVGLHYYSEELKNLFKSKRRLEPIHFNLIRKTSIRTKKGC